MQRIGFPFPSYNTLMDTNSALWILDIRNWQDSFYSMSFLPKSTAHFDILNGSAEPLLAIPWTSKCSAGERCSIKRLFNKTLGSRETALWKNQTTLVSHIERRVLVTMRSRGRITRLG
jgi:hypothetical protein